jgi:tetratricopeptide (TPR) repeat protein
MQDNFTAPTNKYPWLEKVEIASVIGSIGGAIAAVVVNQAAVAAIPLSVTVALNLTNRRILLDHLKQHNLATIAQVLQEQVTTQSNLERLSEELGAFEQQTEQKHGEAQTGIKLLDEHLQLTNNNLQQAQDQSQQSIAQLQQQDVNIQTQLQTQLETLNQQLEQLQQQTNMLVQEQNNRLMNEQAKIARTVDALRDIETCTQSLRINPISANAFFNRGLSYQRLGDREAAIGDFTEAIRVNSQYAEAFQSRGLAYADLGDKKAAVRDLREAARLFFESGEIDKYQIARDLGKKFHDLDSPSEAEALTEAAYENTVTEPFGSSITLESLFS